jgi:hypothetical protein
MKTKRAVSWSLLSCAIACASVAAPGCELLVDFDRSKIPAGDASVIDASNVGEDASFPDASSADGQAQETSTLADGGEGGAADGSLNGAPDGTIPDTGVPEGAAPDATSDGSSTTSDTGTPELDSGLDAMDDGGTAPEAGDQ